MIEFSLALLEFLRFLSKILKFFAKYSSAAMHASLTIVYAFDALLEALRFTLRSFHLPLFLLSILTLSHFH